jgi:predicted oxidoreductase
MLAIAEAGGRGWSTRPDVALHRGHPELGPDLGSPRHQDPARTLVAVARRTGTAVSRAELPWLRHAGHAGAIRETGFDYSWFVLTQKIIEKEFALSGSEQNPDLTGKDIKLTLSRVRPGAPAPVEAFKRNGADFVVARTLPELVEGMNKLTAAPLIDLADLERQIVARDREIDNPFTKDLQVMAIRNARRYRGDRLARTAAPHKILDPKAGPLIAVRLNILTRKTLGGLQTDLSGRVLGREAGPAPRPVPGLYAAGEVAGFGGGGMHGYRSLEGSFLGGCLFSGRQAGRAAAQETGA